MLALFLFIVFGLLFGYFSTLNTSLVSVHFGTYTIAQVPMYMVVIAFFGLGVLFSTLFYFIKSLTISFALNRKENELKSARREYTELVKDIHKLELENAALKTKAGVEEEDDEKSI